MSYFPLPMAFLMFKLMLYLSVYSMDLAGPAEMSTESEQRIDVFIAVDKVLPTSPDQAS